MKRIIGIALLAHGLSLTTAAAQSAPAEHVDRVIAVFLAMDCKINPITSGEKAEKASGLTTLEFSRAVAVLEARGLVTMDGSMRFRLKHKDCP